MSDYSSDVYRLAQLLGSPDLVYSVCAVAAEHQKTEAEVWADINGAFLDPVNGHGPAELPEHALAKLPGHDCNLTELGTVTPLPIRWLWPGRFPLGMYSLLVGQPGVGKSTLAFSIAAILSTGGIWPFTKERAEVGDVLIMTAEDAPQYTLVPRLMAAGADLSRIRMIQSVARYREDRVVDAPLLLSEDMQQLHGVLRQFPNTRLMIFDPLSAYLGVKDSHRDADVRQVLGPLTELADRHDVAVLGISHLSKNAAASAMARVMGSTGIVAAARAAYLATWHEDELKLLPVKSNIAPATGGLTYRIVGKTIGDGIETSAIDWTGQTDVEADEALAAQVAKYSAPKKHDAQVFLKNMLLDGPRPLTEISDAANAEGISWATVRRAYDALKIEAIKERKFQGRWLWYTPDQAVAHRAQEANG